jgi:SAM-dependent methyltransferase
MEFRVTVTKVLEMLRRDGVAATARKAVRNLAPRNLVADPFDVQRGTDTGGLIPIWKLGTESKNARFGVRYQASEEQELIDAVAFANITPSDSVFVDLGCGKGRVLVVASELGFGSVIGVEFAPALVEIAKANISHLALTDVSVECRDASQYLFAGNNLVIYLYNPFSAEVMRGVVENLRASRANALSVIYKRPVCADLFDQCGFLTRLGSPPGNADIIVWAKPGHPAASQ